MKVLVTGAGGLLGRAMVSTLEARDWTAIGAVRDELDITRIEALPEVDAVVNCAAWTDVDRAEDDPRGAFMVNAEAVGRMARLARERGAYLVHVSTYQVFNGCKPTPYREDDCPSPVNNYGATKLAGERLAQESGCEPLVVRLQWLYDAEQGIVSRVLADARRSGRVRAATDRIGAPTPVAEAASAIATLLDSRPRGVVHIASDGAATRYRVAERAVAAAGLRAPIEPCTSGELEDTPRPPRVIFDLDRLRRLGIRMSPWDQGGAFMGRNG